MPSHFSGTERHINTANKITEITCSVAIIRYDARKVLFIAMCELAGESQLSQAVCFGRR